MGKYYLPKTIEYKTNLGIPLFSRDEEFFKQFKIYINIYSDYFEDDKFYESIFFGQYKQQPL